MQPTRKQINSFMQAHQAFVAGDHSASFNEMMRLAGERLADAQHFVGWCYEQGIAVESNPEQAFHWWQKAAEQGIAESQRAIGSMLASGEGCELNRPLGAYWLTIAASCHDENEFVATAADPERELKQLLKKMNPDQIREFKRMADAAAHLKRLGGVNTQVTGSVRYRRFAGFCALISCVLLWPGPFSWSSAVAMALFAVMLFLLFLVEKAPWAYRWLFVSAVIPLSYSAVAAVVWSAGGSVPNTLAASTILGSVFSAIAVFSARRR